MDSAVFLPLLLHSSPSVTGATDVAHLITPISWREGIEPRWLVCSLIRNHKDPYQYR